MHGLSTQSGRHGQGARRGQDLQARGLWDLQEVRHRGRRTSQPGRSALSIAVCASMQRMRKCAGRPRHQPATVIAVGIASHGPGGCCASTGPFGRQGLLDRVLRRLVKRGLRLRHSDANEGSRLPAVLCGTTWRRCRVHFMRNLRATMPQGRREAIAAIVRTTFAQPHHASVLTQLWQGGRVLRDRFTPAAVTGRRGPGCLAYRH